MIEERIRKEMSDKEKEELLIKKLTFQANLIIKYYNEATGYLEIKEDGGKIIKKSLTEHISRITKGVLKEFKNPDLLPKRTLEILGSIETEKGKLNDFEWWKNFVKEFTGQNSIEKFND